MAIIKHISVKNRFYSDAVDKDCAFPIPQAPITALPINASAKFK